MNPSTLSNILYYSFNLLFEYIFVTLYEDAFKYNEYFSIVSFVPLVTSMTNRSIYQLLD